MSVPGGGRVCNMRGRRESPSCSGKVRCARASTGRCFLTGGEGTLVRQSRGRYTEERPLVRCLDASWALKEERDGKDCGSLAAAGFAYDPNLMPRGCPYIGVLPSTLISHDSYPRVTRLMTHSES